jgi:hypothetical protein
MSPSTSKVHGHGKPGKIYDHAALIIQVVGHQARLTGAQVSSGSNSERLKVSIFFPLFPQQRTFGGAVGTSAKCQEETSGTTFLSSGS